MLYNLFKWLFSIAVPAYFRRIRIQRHQPEPTKGTLILAANHPSAFMDPILIAMHSGRKIHFLARAESFKSRFSGWLFPKLNMIPVYRQHTLPEEMHKNAEMFQACYEHLSADGTILIFPEGRNQERRKVLPLKTGAARIALDYASRSQFQQACYIQPIGLNYSNQHHFQSDVALQYGPLISTDAYVAQWNEDPTAAVKAMTQDLETALKKLVWEVQQPDLEDLVERILKLYRPMEGSDDSDALLNPAAAQNAADAVAFFYQVDPQRVATIQTKVDQYYAQLEVLNISDALVRNSPEQKRWNRQLAFLVLGFPLAAVGWLLHIVPYRLSGWVATRMSPDEDFEGSLKLAGGMGIFLGFYVAYFWAMLPVLTWYLTPLALLMIYLSGFFTLFYARLAYRWRKGRRLTNKLRRRSKVYHSLVESRASLLNDLAQAGAHYRAFNEQANDLQGE